MLGCIQPMSSPMMKSMLGFCCGCCAAAGVLAAVTATNDASRPRQTLLVILMDLFSMVWLPEMGRQPAPDVDRFQHSARRTNRDLAAIETDGRHLTSSRSIFALRCGPAILSLGAVSACCGDVADARLSSREAACRNRAPGGLAARSATCGKEVCVGGAAGVGGAQVQTASNPGYGFWPAAVMQAL